MAWTDRLPSALQSLAALGVDTGDPEDVRLEKAMFTLVSCLLALMAFAWVGIYLAIGLPARRIDEGVQSLGETRWVRMADPEHNEFCVCTGVEW